MQRIMNVTPPRRANEIANDRTAPMTACFRMARLFFHFGNDGIGLMTFLLLSETIDVGNQIKHVRRCRNDNRFKTQSRNNV
jgi:hypothetical protein